MMQMGFTTAVYITAIVLFILSLGGLSGQESAKRAVWYGIVGMALAVSVTVFGPGLGLWWVSLILISAGGVLIFLAGIYAPPSFMQHFIVFILAVFVGFQVIWNVSHSLHTPLMAVTNAISSIIILGALLQIGSSSFLVIILAAISLFLAGINIFGGFLVTKRMLAMFQKS